MKDFRKLGVWMKGHRLTLDVYQATKAFPKDKRFGLVSQMRRSSASIPTNIAEGCGRSGDPELARFLQIAMGSASELEYQFILAKDLGYLQEASFISFLDDATQVKKMLASFIRTLNADR